MADCIPLRTKHWAILIGLDFYVKEQCLSGCVRDVSKAKEYLEAGSDPVDITILTATPPLDLTSHLPLEDQDSWPTRANVTRKLKRIIDNAQPGELIYIHYSGHGTREESSAGSAESSSNLDLVLYENDAHGESYFRGSVLANCLNKMVKQGLFVTLVLDCCFSGSVLRDSDILGVAVRSVGYHPHIAAAIPKDHLTDFFDPFDMKDSFRDSILSRDKWLINPNGYTILSACGPHEIARELQLYTGERRGALSYFLMETLYTLRLRNINITHESLYEHMRVRFHASWPQQTPMRYGNTNFSFFSGPVVTSSPSFIRLYTRDGRLCLDAGEAHGVHNGDEYVLCPPNSSKDIIGQLDKTPITAKVDTVRCLTSDLIQVKPEEAAKEIQTGWKEGWQAKAVTSLSSRKISVRLLANVPCGGQQDEPLEDHHYLHICTSDRDVEACTFNVTLNSQGDFEILDGSMEQISSLPTVPSDGQEADQNLMDILQHLSKFKYAEGIENKTPDPFFEAKFSIVSSVGNDESGKLSVFDIQHGDIWRLSMKNESEEALYMALFDFTPSWKIQNLLSSVGDNGFRVIEPGATEHLQLKMKVPEFLQSQGKDHCEDIIKVFITSRATSFPSMILPSISLSTPQHRGNYFEAGEGLTALIESLTISVRSDNISVDKWATRNFIIRTTLR